MLILKDQIRIDAAPEKIFGFFDTMNKEQYLAWHPKDHHDFKWIGNAGVKVGNKFQFRESIGGKTMQKTVVFSRVDENKYIEFVLENRLLRLILRKLSFRIEPAEGGCNFIAEIHILTGPLGAYLNKKEFDAVRIHMREEGENLKKLMEE